VVSSHEANVMLQEAISQLTIFLKSKMDGPELLRSQFEAYYFVLAEPYFEFPTNWHEKWKLINTFLTDVDFGSLGYGDDGLADITATLRPDYCVLLY
jgi:hypothetical protein